MSDTMLAPTVLDNLEEFLELVKGGTGPKNAAVIVGWTLKQLHDLERLPQFQEAMAFTEERRLESVEEHAYKLAFRDNVPMIQMILYCKGADRGWRPPTQRVAVHHQGTVAVEKIMATKAALLEIMEAHGAEALAIGGPLDDIVDAEVVDGAD